MIPVRGFQMIDKLLARLNFRICKRKPKAMKIQTYTVSKHALMDMPAKERDFFLLVGHFANEVIFLSKLLIITRYQASEKIPAKAELTQALFIHRTLAGKLYEGWQMIQKYYFGTSISKDYNELLEKDAQEAIKQLKRYFDNKRGVQGGLYLTSIPYSGCDE